MPPFVEVLAVTLSTWLAFFVASWIISLSPGAGAISCMAAGLRHGYARAMWNILGLQIGIVFMLVVVAVGLGAILAASSLAFAVVKWLGVAYLVWLGIQQWRAPAFAVDAEAEAARKALDGAPKELVLRGFFVNATNPKGIVFMLAVLPQFIDPLRPQFVQYAICAGTIFFTDLVVMSGYTAFAAKVLGALREPHHVRWINRTIGGLFVAAGAALAVFKKAA
jgi:homoserine/homoserine lactone efflux protein